MNEGFAERFREAREQAGYSQAQLGAMVGISDRQISRYERGLSLPRGVTLEKLSNVLGLSSEFLLKGFDIFFVDEEREQLGNLYVRPFEMATGEFEGSFCCLLQTNSLEPWYFNDEYLIIDPFIKRQIGRKLPKYAVFLIKDLIPADSEEYKFKCINYQPNGLANLWVPNHEFPPILARTDEFEIIGKVVGSFEG